MIAEIVKVVIAAIVYGICMEVTRRATGVEIKAPSSTSKVIYFIVDVTACYLMGSIIFAGR